MHVQDTVSVHEAGIGFLQLHIFRELQLTTRVSRNEHTESRNNNNNKIISSLVLSILSLFCFLCVCLSFIHCLFVDFSGVQ